MKKQETNYIIEYLEKGSYVLGFDTLPSQENHWGLVGPNVATTTKNPFEARRFNDKNLVERVVDLLQYQGRNKARKYAKLIEITITLEVNDE